MSNSPAWKNPRDRIVKLAKRKSSMRLVMPPANLNISDDFNTESCPPSMGTLTPRSASSNPFKIGSPQKKRSKVEVSTPQGEGGKEFAFDWDDSTANDSFSTAAASKISQMSPMARSMSAQVYGESSGLLDFSALGGTSMLESPSQSSFVAEQRSSDTIPSDYRLGTKLRITSKVPFSWMKNTKTTGNVLVRMNGKEKSEGMQCFMDISEDSGQLEAKSSVYGSGSLLEGACLYWQYPSLPWLTLFPRIESLLKNMPKQTAPPLASPMLEIINRQWSESFEHLFMSWKKGNRRKFYVVCPSFTVHFSKSNKAEKEADPLEDSMSCFQAAEGQHVAVITPTNMGFRHFLNTEGVDFELCSYKKRRLSKVKFALGDNSMDSGDLSLLSAGDSNSSELQSSEASGEAAETSLGEKENEEEAKKEVGSEEDSPTKGHCGDQEWLKDIGYSPRNQLKLRRHRSMVSTVTNTGQGGGKIAERDRDETSAVIITGTALQALYNVLQTSKVTRAIAGPHANLPPTLLAEKPFLFGQMQTLKKSSQVLKRNGQAPEFVLELDGGPIMPHSVELAAAFARSANLVKKDPASLRVNDRTSCAGLNGVESASEWHEIKVGQAEYFWPARS